MRAVGYVRVSTEEQASTGCSLAAQADKIRSYCGLYGISLVDIIEDAGQSAKTLGRPGLQQVLSMLDVQDIDGIVICKLDRLTRSVRDWATLIERYFGGKASLLSVDDKIDTASAAGRVVLNLLICISQWERETIGERTSTALRHRQRQGIHVGSAPFGARIKDGRLIQDEEELQVITLALRYRQMMMSYEDIADEFIRLKIPTKRGGQWRSQTVRQITLRHMEGRNGEKT